MKKVRLVHPTWGEKSDKGALRILGLRKGRVYAETRREVFSWRTEIELEEFPGQVFNAIQFEEVGL